MSESQSAGGIHYDVSMDIKELLVGEKQVNKVMDNVEKSTTKATDSLNKLDKTAAQVGVALKMPEVNKLSRELSQLSGKIGANSSATDKATQTHNKFTGVLSTVSGSIGAGYVGNIGNATETLIKHTQAAINATAEEVKNAEAMQKQAQAYQAEASQLVLSTQEKRKAAEEAIKLAESELQVAEALADRKTAQIESLEALHKEQTYQLKQAELAHETIGNEKTLAEVVKARSAAQRTQNQIEKQSNAIAQEVWNAEDKVKSAKEAHKKATIELAQAEVLEKQAKVTATAADEAATVARNRATAATKAQAVAMNGLRSVMALFGGPSGVLLLAAAGVYALYQAMSNSSSIDDYKNKVNEAIQKVDELTQSQAKAAANQAKLAIKADTESLDKVAKRIKEVQATIKYMEENPFEWMQNAGAMAYTYESRLASLKNKLDELRGEYDTYAGSVDNLATQQDKLNIASEAGPIATGDAAKSVKILKSEYSSLYDQHVVLNELLLNGAQAAELMAYKLNLENKYAEQGVAITDDIRRSIDDAVASKKQLMETQGAANLKQQLDSIKTNVEALKIEYQQGAKAAAIFRAEQFLSKQEGLDPKIAKEYIEGVKQQYEWQGKVNDQRKSSSALSKVSTKDTQQAADALNRLEAELTRLNQGYAEGSLELAQYDAVQALGAKALPEQIALAEERAKSIWEVQAATKAATKAEEDRKNSQANFTSLQESVSPVTAIDNQFAKQMEQINQYKQLYPQSIAEAEALRSQIEEQYRQKRMDAQWQELSNASLGYNMLTSAVDSFGGNASNVITGLATGTMDAADAARSLGNTMLNSVVNSLVQVGVEMLKNFIIGQTMGNAAAAASAGQAALVATAWAPAAALSSLATLGANAVAANSAIVGTVGVAKGMAVAGARYNGGPVGAGQMYQVGEHGKPEIFKASTGKQYMIPGDNGRVISNKDMQGSGNGITLNIEFNDYSSGKHQFEAQASQNGDTLTVQAFLTDMQEKGPMHRSITQNTTATTRL
ncbi:hypothetical protein LHV25_21845 [Providencia rettgeri]|uniref:hypothetical protein n=1 Tax=Providencia rettgeri TaxID=587 RepID=UPI001B38E6A7|nr:hypothetical protein [Providencia rettgeri]MBQ0262596.1 hypothetical protein [Providencia rettgeri]MCB4857630.1 hypothetical protein [Providencia rettgeri]MCD6316949.1 hypothetical protein [Providencia rettgeri]